MLLKMIKGIHQSRSTISAFIMQDFKDDNLKISGLKPNFIFTLFHLIALISILILNFTILTIYPSHLTYIISFLVNSVIFYHLAVSIHEAAHFTLIHPKKLNEVIGGIISTLIFMDLKNYRNHHMEHHRMYGLDIDPDYMNYNYDLKKYKNSIFKFMLYECLGIFAFKRFINKTLRLNKSKKSKNDEKNRILAIISKLVLTHIIIIITLHKYSIWQYYFFFYLLPIITLSTLFNRVRLLCEHGGFTYNNITKSNQIEITRTHYSNSILFFLEKTLFSPFNFNFHFEHHLFPGVPRNYLKYIHQKISKRNIFEYLNHNFSESYLKTLDQIIKGK